MIENSYLILLWAVTTYLGWFATGIGFLQAVPPSTILLLWGILMSAPLGITLWKQRKNDSNKIFDLWSLLVVFMLLENVLSPSNLLFFSYYPLWALGVAAGFYYTSRNIPPPSQKTYLYAAAINLLAAPLMYIVSPEIAAAVAGIVQAGPIFWDWWKIHR